MRIGMATDHGGEGVQEALLICLRAAGHEAVDVGAHRLNPSDDSPDCVIPRARAVATGEVERGAALCGSGVGAAVCATKVPGICAALMHDHVSARQGVEDDHRNVMCMGGRTVGPVVAWDLVQTFLAAALSQDERHLRCLGTVAALEAGNQQGHAKGDTHGRREDCTIGDQYDPYPRDGCGPAGQLRPSGYADGARARGLLPVAALPAL